MSAAKRLPVFQPELRDWLAGQALVGLLANPGTVLPHSALYAAAADASYEIADAMLKARSK